MKTALLSLLIFLVSFSSWTGIPAHAEDPALPAPLCVLTNSQIMCYDMQTATPSLITPSRHDVIDFAISTDGKELVYRTPINVMIVGINTSVEQQIDQSAAPPADLDLTQIGMAWCEETIAYITANGLRVVMLGMANNQIIDNTSRLYINLRFSPDCTWLAAQAVSGGWSLFPLTKATVLQATAYISQICDLAWFDNQRFVIAPRSGGLIQYKLQDGKLIASWTVNPTEHYVKLIKNRLTEVLAMHVISGDNIGNTVMIFPDGTIKALGDAKIDMRAQWGPDGDMMLYITSGTPILTDRATGAEDMLPVRHVTKLAWGPIPAGPVMLCQRGKPCRAW